VRGQGHPKGRLVLAVQLLLAVGVMAGVAIGLLQAAVGGDGSSTAMPSELGGLRLVQAMTGADALAEIYSLHQKDLGLVDGWVGHYEGGATVWASQARDREHAATLLASMSRDIQAGEGPFIYEGQEQVRDSVLHRLRGPGGLHYFYQRDSMVIWVTAPPAVARAFMVEAVEHIR